MTSPGVESLGDAKQVLGERLFAKVEALCPGQTAAARVTGILLEAGDQEVLHMLQDDGLLDRRIQSAVRVIRDEYTDPVLRAQQKPNFDKDSLGTRLYLKVQEIESQHCAKITGMLLEMDAVTLSSLLSSPQDLVRAVQKATTTLLMESPEDQSCGNEVDEEKQELGEELYCLIEEAHPELASKLTGMLLEMDVLSLRELVDNPSKLNEKVQLALDALRKAAALDR